MQGTGGAEAGMAETRRNAKLGALDEYLVQFSQKMPQRARWANTKD